MTKTHGGARANSGRKAADESGRRLEIRVYLTPQELALVESFNTQNLKRSEFLRETIFEALEAKNEATNKNP